VGEGGGGGRERKISSYDKNHDTKKKKDLGEHVNSHHNASIKKDTDIKGKKDRESKT
jgi:hypothetical protein